MNSKFSNTVYSEAEFKCGSLIANPYLRIQNMLSTAAKGNLTPLLFDETTDFCQI